MTMATPSGAEVMPTQETVKELLEKVRAAEKPSRQLDFAIRRAAYGSLPTYDGDTQPNWVREYTGSLDACLSLLGEVLPGWAWKVGTCCISDDAWVVPDFNCPVHGERLRAQFPNVEHGSIWDTGIDIDRRPPGNVPLALLEAILQALLLQQAVKENT